VRDCVYTPVYIKGGTSLLQWNPLGINQCYHTEMCVCLFASYYIFLCSTMSISPGEHMMDFTTLQFKAQLSMPKQARLKTICFSTFASVPLPFMYTLNMASQRRRVNKFLGADVAFESPFLVHVFDVFGKVVARAECLVTMCAGFGFWIPMVVGSGTNRLTQC